ncbi:hypothetical protein Vadar_011116 [Vaccinium darrowii]|nr:hypothetical protein Vadar_011116 [Vaccinium darrowii]
MMLSPYFAKGQGIVNMWDERAGKALTPWTLHSDRINTIDFSTNNTNIMATSSTDGTACIWDLRFVDAVRPNPLNTVSHKRAVHSAYFSPSGSCLATTSFDDKVGLLTGANFEDSSMMHHNNQTGRWISSFRAIWGWDDSYLFIGNMNRAVDIISSSKRTSIGTLESPHVSAIPCRFDAHPYRIGMLAGATSGGQTCTVVFCNFYSALELVIDIWSVYQFRVNVTWFLVYRNRRNDILLPQCFVRYWQVVK